MSVRRLGLEANMFFICPLVSIGLTNAHQSELCIFTQLHRCKCHHTSGHYIPWNLLRYTCLSQNYWNCILHFYSKLCKYNFIIFCGLGGWLRIRLWATSWTAQYYGERTSHYCPLTDSPGRQQEGLIVKQYNNNHLVESVGIQPTLVQLEMA